MVHNMAPVGLKVCVCVCVFLDIHESLSVFKCVTDRLLAYAQYASVQQSKRVRLCAHMCSKCQCHIQLFFTGPHVDESLDLCFKMCVCVYQIATAH